MKKEKTNRQLRAYYCIKEELKYPEKITLEERKKFRKREKLTKEDVIARLLKEAKILETKLRAAGVILEG